MCKRHSGLRPGYTFAELVVCATLIFVLMGLLLPAMLRTREGARRTQCASNLKQLGMALHLYAQDHSGRFPPEDQNWGPVQPYSKNVQILRCESDPTVQVMRRNRTTLDDEDEQSDGADKASHHSSYLYRGGLTSDLSGHTLLARDAEPWHAGSVNILDLGGGVRRVSVSEGKRLWAQGELATSSSSRPGAASR